MNGINFFNLPRELRDVIYVFVIPEVNLTGPRIKGQDRIPNFFSTNGILLANHQMRREAKETFWRLLPSTTVTIAPKTHMYCLISPAYARLRRTTQYLVVQMEQYNHRLPIFTLAESTPQMRFPLDNTKGYIAHIIRVMPALRQVTCDIEWKPHNTPSVLLPRERDDMLRELRRVTTGGDPMIGWEVKCYIVDATRWKKECSGGVRFKRKAVPECYDLNEHPPSSAT
jgi:hypothetical protein